MSGYDERLLASAPAATREARQEGYNVDLLDDGSRKAGSTSPETQHAPLASNHGHAEAALSKEVLPSYATTGTSVPVPWWRTKKFIIFAVIFAVAAIAAIVGGAVGGTVNHNKGGDKNNASTTSAPSATSTSASPSVTDGGNPIGEGPGTTDGGQIGNNSATARSSEATTTSSDPNVQPIGTNLAVSTPSAATGIAGEVD